MSKTKKTAAKSTKPAKTKGAPTSDAKPAGECPKGGKHEWVTEDGETACKNCFEPKEPPKGKKGKSSKAAKAAKAKKESGPKKLSAINSAAQVLADAKEPMTCQELIEAMEKKGLWASPGGKTPAATLYSAILREIQNRGADSRFKKTERGKFAAK
ncbi:MAG: winged helix-turn-helix domain-containing protein [Pirellulaceae bacterium]|nr:winged helix-turn-helix domain-containing protein [Pirellulaceae bacterium]